MKSKLTITLIKRAAQLVLLSTLIPQPSTSFAQGTAFTYQGRLNFNVTPANGIYDFRFMVYDAPSGGSSIAGPITNSTTGVTNGLFTVALDFGGTAFGGANRWLDIGVRTNGNGGFTSLSPRQAITSTPYAITAESANNLSDLRIQQHTSGAPNLIGGSSVNSVSNGVSGATIGGGGATNYNGLSHSNTVSGDFGTVSGGLDNTASDFGAAVGGGEGNTASALGATVGGGQGNTASGFLAAVVGGDHNVANFTHAFVGGGFNNTASGFAATVAGGGFNIAASDYCFAAGAGAQALHFGSFVWKDDTAGSFASTTTNQFSVRAAGGIRFIGDVQIGDGEYRHLQMGGGNSSGFLYGAYNPLGDGIHLGYNFYYDAGGVGHVINTGGGTARISAGYGEVILAVGGVNTSPNSVRLDATTAGVSVYGTFNNNSDRNAKQDFAPLNPLQILDKVTQLPITEWSYKTDVGTRHVGPMAQDFYASFEVGTDDKHIAPIDEGGVAFAAIQGLNEKVEQKETEIRELKQTVAELKQLVEAINLRMKEDTKWEVPGTGKAVRDGH